MLCHLLCYSLYIIALRRADQFVRSLLLALQAESLDKRVKATATATVIDDSHKWLAKDEREGDPVKGVCHHTLCVEDPLEPRLYGR